MGRRNRIVASLLTLACATSTALANKKVFNIHDDLLAFPQYQVLFPDEYVLDSHAKELLRTQSSPPVSDDQQGNSLQKPQIPLEPRTDGSQEHSPQQEGGPQLTYEELTLQGQRFLCQIPQVEKDESGPTNRTKEASETDEKQELARATERGLELLSEMEGKCMYYVSGWWSYSFCYKKQIKQFHALPSGSGIPNYPPMEDPATHSFILGRFSRANEEEDGEAERKRTAEATTTATTTDVAELQTNGGSRYLVQRLEGGTKCDLTGKNRKIEVQFHCHPQSTDRIGWIKELTTCSYLMVIYTPRLCNDVAFLPPQQEELHSIECREVLLPDQVPDWEAMRQYHLAQRLVESSATTSEFPIVGDIEVGAKKLVGTEGKEIEKGRVASAGEEKVEVVAKRENGEVLQLSKVDLEKLGLDPEKIETLKTRLEELAQGKDWTLEHVTANGERGLRGIVDTDEDEEEEETGAKSGTESEDHGTTEKPQEKAPAEKKVPEKEVLEAKPKDEPKGEELPADNAEEGSEEIFKDEL
ncbi:glucosidase II beta subunit-like protein-domain-containing protein [Aspergillus pseudonomiae]|uniref:Endoplasmic reticulum lectin n=1 Tax=Aspergillus pseudonomiae TaxID=1506151 RepID=A0A5N6I9R4_9EURO|nr:glucosidase II beta subunit-like protein-domain-containing protein [Aspergillus pseudonomiae]KAB8263405.1 glucosidase II beta subunit-like protein-domain-containing protein [Aspergillus pseudonomiae]KAE8409942.1 glucosidase II beta subunit-like protein-domain-containing protein [Aspergillus pseudonomiae]